MLELTKSPRASSARQKITEIDGDSNDTVSRVPASMSDLRFDLALWARGLESFCSVGRNAFPNESVDLTEDRNYRNEFYIEHIVLIRCSELIEEIDRNGSPLEKFPDQAIGEFRDEMKSLIACSGAFTRIKSLNFAEWNAWSEIVASRIAGTKLYQGFDREFEIFGSEYLPERFMQLLGSDELTAADRADLNAFLPILGGILRSLDVARKMLARDVPLKSALVIFAFIYESVNELVFEMNERLSYRDDETSEIFAMFDAATYTLTIESKKVFSHELASVIHTRSATAVFAHVESACGLLNDNIRHLLAGFLRLSEPGIAAVDLFPEFTEKLHHSLKLRSDLWTVMDLVRSTETDTAGGELELLRSKLESFLQSSIAYLFYKDRETFERFCNEIIASPDGQDTRAILHRFSAYAETLFNQVGMRVVLANHPFTPNE